MFREMSKLKIEELKIYKEPEKYVFVTSLKTYREDPEVIQDLKMLNECGRKPRSAQD